MSKLSKLGLFTNWVCAQPATNLIKLGGELPDPKLTYKGIKLVSSGKALGVGQLLVKPKTVKNKKWSDEISC